ncbi:quinoprotein dehydrogenase-associated putative ABC transporter substrate-binding protein [Proteobacteria bacterium 005FR1]|nr:quinoprotein dehydrogenase-associated putative ABC transporter substrate-binding protein [Proteobacteria bacterium 005FR1]
MELRGVIPVWLCTLLMSVGALPVLAADAATRTDIAGSHPPALRVCADPNNLPFSNRQEEGFENRLVELISEALDRKLEYTWWPQRRGFLRNTLYAGKCDLVAGMPSSHEMVLTTRAYYRSSYIFLQRRGSEPRVQSFDDQGLREMKVGVHLIGDDGMNSPPAHALGRRGIINNVVGFSVYGDYSKANPPARLVEAVADGRVDVAVVWGPLGGYFADRQQVPLTVTPVSPLVDIPALSYVFSISMAVRLDDHELKAELDDVLFSHKSEIRAILDEFNVPTL